MAKKEYTRQRGGREKRLGMREREKMKMERRVRLLWGRAWCDFPEGSDYTLKVTEKV